MMRPPIPPRGSSSLDELDELIESVIKEDNAKGIHTFIPNEYMDEVEDAFLRGEKVICHPRNTPKYMMIRGNRFDWRNNFYERIFPKNNNVQSTQKNGSNRRAGIYDSIRCYVKTDDDHKIGSNNEGDIQGS